MLFICEYANAQKLNFTLRYKFGAGSKDNFVKTEVFTLTNNKLTYFILKEGQRGPEQTDSQKECDLRMKQLGY